MGFPIFSNNLQEIIRKYPDRFAGAPVLEKDHAFTPSTVFTNYVHSESNYFGIFLCEGCSFNNIE